MSSNTLAIWVVYENPTDFPGHFVARKWLMETPTTELLLDTCLEELRKKLPPGLARLARADIDDPKIVETWL